MVVWNKELYEAKGFSIPERGEVDQDVDQDGEQFLGREVARVIALVQTEVSLDEPNGYKVS